ncbi:hypothetical protein GCM10010368_48670 [Streptomyces roseiscleroticus]|uniref:Transposase InsH N-terminal domain-containing protein n=1 Tax=Streptomyces roseiscleroticus TaxID=1972 RepID=A0ABN3EVG0_9ACTN
MQARDVLDALFSDADFVDLFPVRGRPALSPARLALVSVLQFVEGLTDRQAADAVRARIDWKYALGLELTDAGFDFSVLSEFRLRLVPAGQEQRLLQKVLDAAVAAGVLRPGGRMRTDSTHVLGALRVVNRLELVQESMRSALNSLAAAAPEWLVRHVEPAWFDRYNQRCEDFRLSQQPHERAELALATGRDGRQLLRAVFRPGAPAWLREISAVETLRRVWVQQYLVDGRSRVQWRQQDNLPPAAVRIESAYELQVRWSIKRSTAWTGYKVQMSASQ